MTDATTTHRLPQEWMTFDWILAQGDRVDMNQRELFTVDAAVRLIRHILQHGNLELSSALAGLVLEAQQPGESPLIKPLALQMVLDSEELLVIAKMYGQLTMTDETIELCRSFTKRLQATADLANDVAMTPRWTFAQTATTPFSEHDLELVDEVVHAIGSAALINGNTVEKKLRGLMIDDTVTPLGLHKFLNDHELVNEVRSSQRHRTTETSLEYCKVFLRCLKDAS